MTLHRITHLNARIDYIALVNSATLSVALHCSPIYLFLLYISGAKLLLFLSLFFFSFSLCLFLSLSSLPLLSLVSASLCLSRSALSLIFSLSLKVFSKKKKKKKRKKVKGVGVFCRRCCRVLEFVGTRIGKRVIIVPMQQPEGTSTSFSSFNPSLFVCILCKFL
jgi:hypothetical protein